MGCSASESRLRRKPLGGRWGRLGIPALALAVAGCAGFPPPLPNRSVPDRVDALEKRLSDVGKALDQQQKRLAKLEESGPEPGAAGQAETKGLSDRVEALKKRIKALEGSTEVNGHELDRLSQQLEDTYQGLKQRVDRAERRLAKLEDRQSQRAQRRDEPMSAPDRSPPPGEADGSGGDDATPEDVKRYQAAFDQLMDGQYEPAIEAFRQFLGDFPESQYADNAQYWLGEAYYVQQNYERALEAFKKVQREFPGSDKVPAALLKEGYAYYELQDYRMARKTLLEVTERFPDHRVAELARQRMDRIRKERI